MSVAIKRGQTPRFRVFSPSHSEFIGKSSILLLLSVEPESLLSVASSIAVKMPFGLGELPKEYNKAVHGPYDPAMYYGKGKILDT